MDEIDRAAMNLEFLMAQHRATPHKELPMVASDAERITVSYPGKMLAQIDRYRGKRPNPPSRSVAIREIMAIGLAKIAADEKEAKR